MRARPQRWVQYRERGSLRAMQLLLVVTRLLGRHVGRLVLVPICLYFLLFARRAVRASRAYLARVHGRAPTLAEVYRHLYCFAAVLLDRVLLLAGHRPALNVTVSGSEPVAVMARERRACLLLGAHLGSFDVARFAGSENCGVTINMLMRDDATSNFSRLVESTGARERLRIIPVGGTGVLLRAKECLDAGEWVGILGDRTVGGERVVTVPFLGQPAQFPVGPILAASVLCVPVVLFFSLYRGGNRYEAFFELFAEQIVLERRDRQAAAEVWVRRYVARLEHHCRRAPYNWFNFYDFWATAPQPEPGTKARTTA
ncbi:MAG TPA: hypothetical protein VJ396_02490 [Acidiferrobacterales bacterium]|nr:hypothetical protein [Acidiferrobacterales bacterium]